MSAASVRIGDLLELQRRPVDIKVDRSYVELGIRSFGRGVFRKPPVVGGELGAKRVFSIRPHDLLVSNVFAWEGAVAVVGPEHETSIGSHRFMSWIPTHDVDVSYIAHYLLSERGMDQLRQASPGSAGRNRTLSIKNFEAIEVPLPALSGQRRIASHLDQVALVASKNQGAMLHRRALTRAVENSVVQEAVGQRQKLGDLLTMRTGELVVDDSQYRMAGVYSFGRGLLDRGVMSGGDTKYKTLTALRRGNVVYSKLGAFENAVAIVDGNFERSFVSPEFPVFEVCESVNSDFLRAALTTAHFAEALGSATSGVGARQKGVSPNAFLGLEIRLPRVETQERVAEMLRVAQRADLLMLNATVLAEALVPAARNEIFSGMQ